MWCPMSPKGTLQNSDAAFPSLCQLTQYPPSIVINGSCAYNAVPGGIHTQNRPWAHPRQLPSC